LRTCGGSLQSEKSSPLIVRSSHFHLQTSDAFFAATFMRSMILLQVSLGGCRCCVRYPLLLSNISGMAPTIRVVLIFVALSISFASGDLRISTGDFDTTFASGSGVLKSLVPKINPTFDFSPSDYFHYRDGDGQYHTGDITLQVRAVGESTWTSADTSVLRRNVTVPSRKDGDAVISSLNTALHNTTNLLNVTRTWRAADVDLALDFEVENIAHTPVEIGALGIPIEFNNIFLHWAECWLFTSNTPDWTGPELGDRTSESGNKIRSMAILVRAVRRLSWISNPDV
jgi:hypothetical protein